LPYDNFVMLRAYMRSHLSSELQLRVPLIVEADRKRMEVPVPEFNCGGGQGAGIKTATQENSDRHVGRNQSELNCIEQQVREFAIDDFIRSCIAEPVRRHHVRVPVFNLTRLAATGCELERMPRWQLPYALPD
jgi:hypothetical protein